MSRKKIYEGIDKEPRGAMTPTANIIRDAWVFGIIPESETCAGWTVQRIDALYDQVSDAWAPHGHLASRLPPELRERHARIYGAERVGTQSWARTIDRTRLGGIEPAPISVEPRVLLSRRHSSDCSNERLKTCPT